MNQTALDPIAIRQLVQIGLRVNRNLIEDMIQLFEPRAEQLISDLIKAISDGEKAKAASLTHALIGSAMQVGATDLIECCRTIENWCSGKSTTLDDGLDVRLKTTLTLVMAALKTESDRIKRS
jgi:HPt (histidine-containing phosphotransfer) domain-containing protein